MSTRLRIELFDGLRVQTGSGSREQFRTHKAAALLGYLALFPDHRHTRDELLERFWPDCGLDQARTRLSSTLWQLRHDLAALGVEHEGLLQASREGVRLAPERISTDVAEFEAALTPRGGETAEECRVRLVAAAHLYRGELLHGFYEDWLLPERLRLAGLYRRALGELVRVCEREDRLTEAVQYAACAVRSDPLDEEAQLRVMRLYVQVGQGDLALRHFREYERRRREELDLVPGPEMRALAARISGSQPRSAGLAGPAERPPERPSGPVVAAGGEREPVGGAVPVGSPFYTVRPEDLEFERAVGRQDSLILVEGARETGKSSLLAQGAAWARRSGFRVVHTDLAAIPSSQMATCESLLKALMESLAEGLDLEPAAGPRWEERRANLCLRRFLRDRVLAAAPPLLWIVDHADRLARWPYGEDVFSLFRSWHNERAFDPGGPWSRLTLALAHAIEATLLVRDSNRSPFNVGTRLALTDFTPAQVAGLNGKLGFPLRSSTEETRFYRLVGGHPYLVRRGLSELAARGRTLAELETSAGRNPEIFGEHLGRTWGLLADHPELLAAVRTVLEGKSPPAAAPFRQLRTLGILVGETTHEAGPRCGLYRAYLCDRLREADDGTGATG